MKIFISADIEGIAGVMRPEQCSPGHAEYQIARSLMEQEVNAAIEGAFRGGASQVVVADSHAQMTNLRAAMLDSRARLVQGKPRALSMIEGIEQQAFDGMMCIGFHTAAGETGVLAHTINSRAFWRVKINGQVMGETDIYAAAAAEQGTPLLLVSGDDHLQKWINRYYPQTAYACVKRAISNTAAESMSPQQAGQTITAAAEQAVRQCRIAVSPIVTTPYRLELLVTRPVLADVFALIPGVEREDGVTVSYQTGSIRELVSLLSTFSTLAMTQI